MFFPPRKDVQICLTVLRKRNIKFDGDRALNFKNVDIRRANLKDVDLRKASLNGSMFAGANLIGANLSGVRGLYSEQLKLSIISHGGEILSNDNITYEKLTGNEQVTSGDTIFPNQFKVKKSGKHGFKVLGH